MGPEQTARWKHFLPGLLVAATAVGLTAVFWPGLWSGGGLLGGDLYAYYLPQKVFYAECLGEGTLPFWNHLVGNGYPQLAESQTGALYPLNLVLYRTLSVNTAYVVSQLFHYALAFCGCWLLSRRLELARLPAALSALVYTYGWFPARISLEWAILGGSWLPLALWCVESGLRQSGRRWPVWLSVVLALQLLAGHFLIAFLTQLLIVVYLPLRLWLRSAGASVDASRPPLVLCRSVVVALGLSYLLAAVQLVPTWELKRLSQRAGVNDVHAPDFGAVPPRYLAQVVAPWYWYADKARFVELHTPDRRERINRIDAHLYFGLLPVLLCPCGMWWAWRHGRRDLAAWAVPGVLAVLYMPGWFLPLTRHLPGFSYFEGPGRYGIIATLAVALLAGFGLQAARNWFRPLLRPLVTIGVLLLTAIDLLWVSDLVHDAEPVDDPPIHFVARSTLRQTIETRPPTEPLRVFSDGYNVPSLVGAGTLPVYLGLAPGAYYDRELRLPEPLPFQSTPPTVAQIDWLRRMGVTHILSTLPLETDVWPVHLVWGRPDLCLNPILTLGPTKMQFLYALEGTRGRLAWLNSSTDAPPRLIEYTPQRVVAEAAADQGGMLVLTDLAYPGWQVTLDEQPVKSQLIEGLLRGAVLPPGSHRVVWSFHPTSFYYGVCISVVAVVGMVGWIVWPRRQSPHSPEGHRT